MKMDRKLAVVADGSEVSEEADVLNTDVLNIGSITISADGATFIASRPGVVCKFHASTDGSDPVITVGLDQSKWHEASPRISGNLKNNEPPEPDHPPYGHCEACGCRRLGRTSDPRLCLSCLEKLSKEAHASSAAVLREAHD